MVCKDNGIAPSTDDERTTLHSLPEARQHRLYYCASTSTSFPVCRVKLTNILPAKTSPVSSSPSKNCWMSARESGKRESLLIPLPLTFTIFPDEGLPLVFH